jgi:hypothetical protein
MTIQELEDIVTKTEQQGLSRTVLIIYRKNGPSGNKIRVKGMGLGDIVNVQDRNGMVETVAWFQIKDVKRYIGLVKASEDSQ